MADVWLVEVAGHDGTPTGVAWIPVSSWFYRRQAVAHAKRLQRGNPDGRVRVRRG